MAAVARQLSPAHADDRDWLTWILGVYYRNLDPVRGVGLLAEMPASDHPNCPVAGRRAIYVHLLMLAGRLDDAAAELDRPLHDDGTTAVGKGWLARARAV